MTPVILECDGVRIEFDDHLEARITAQKLIPALTIRRVSDGVLLSHRSRNMFALNDREAVSPKWAPWHEAR